MTTIEYKRNGESIDKHIDTGTEPNTPAVVNKHKAYRQLRIILQDGEVINNGSDYEKVTIKTVDGLEVARGTPKNEASILDYDGNVTLIIDGVETTKTLTNGSVSFDVTTDKPAGSEIEIVAESLADYPAEADSATIEVIE